MKLKKLLVTHTDRDGILAGAVVLRAFPEDEFDIVLTQGRYLAAEFEDLVQRGQVYEDIYVCDTYWHAPHEARVAKAVECLLPTGEIPWGHGGPYRPLKDHRLDVFERQHGRIATDEAVWGMGEAMPTGGAVHWFDHHDATHQRRQFMASCLPLSPGSRIVGESEGRDRRTETVSLVREALLPDDPEALRFEQLVRPGACRDRRAVFGDPDNRRWLDRIDGLALSPDFPPAKAELLVRALADDYCVDPPVELDALADARHRSLADLDRLAGCDFPAHLGGGGARVMVLDLSNAGAVNDYELQRRLYHRSRGAIDAFVILPSRAGRHYVTSPTAKEERARAERFSGSLPPLRVSTTRKDPDTGLNLGALFALRPGQPAIRRWAVPHPYYAKAWWSRDVDPAGDALDRAVNAVALAVMDLASAWRRANETKNH